ncbi:MAG: phosphoribosylglycinamide formyltransferase [Candidatus Omnitrophica bacterium]|nr:phosphoribosylglycinamide formyltransferase [Candidatus Omnitrophota bacterium]MBD3268948.1 phosphoribosylglycinamide formyltransferase [Candidatus Omnitrophota bacterium]
MKIKIAILASGNGSNFEALAKSVKKFRGKVKLEMLITDKKNAYVRKRATRLGIPDFFLDPKKFKTPLALDKEIFKLLKKKNINYVLLAGYMRFLSPFLIKKFENRILNIHPSLLPAFKGGCAIKDAYRHGVKITGVTIHFADEHIDNGPIILQKPVRVKEGWSPEELEKAIHRLEHRLYPQALKIVVEKRFRVRGRRVDVFPAI